MMLRTRPQLTVEGIRLILGQAACESVILQVLEVERKCDGHVARCTISDGSMKLKILLLLESPKKEDLRSFDLIEVEKDHTNQVEVQQSVFLEIYDYTFLNHHTCQLGHPLDWEQTSKVPEAPPSFHSLQKTPVNRQITKRDTEERKTSTLQVIKIKDFVESKLVLNRADTWAIEGTLTTKTKRQMSDNKYWMQCTVVGACESSVRLLFFTRVEQLFEELVVGQRYEMSNLLVMTDKLKNKPQMKACQKSIFKHLPRPQKVTIRQQLKPSEFDLKNLDCDQKNDYLNKIAFVTFVQNAQIQGRKLTAAYLVDKLGNYKKLVIWQDFNIDLSGLDKVVVLKNIVYKHHLGEFHATRSTEVLSQKQGMLEFDFVTPDFDQSKYIFCRLETKYHNNRRPVLELIPSKTPFFVVGTILLPKSAVLVRIRRCRNCSQVCRNTNYSCCADEIVEERLSLTGVLDDNTMSVSVFFQPNLTQRMMGLYLDPTKEIDEKTMELANKRLHQFKFSRELVKLSVSMRKGDMQVQVMDILQRSVHEETKTILELLRKV